MRENQNLLKVSFSIPPFQLLMPLYSLSSIFNINTEPCVSNSSLQLFTKLFTVGGTYPTCNGEPLTSAGMNITYLRKQIALEYFYNFQGLKNKNLGSRKGD